MTDARGGAPRVVLVVSPHRDDESIGCGGVIAAHVASGDEVHVLEVCGQGAPDDECRKATTVLGVSDVDFLNYPPVLVQATEGLLIDVIRIVRSVRPTELYVPHSEDDDPTHRVVSEIGVEAAWLAGYPTLEHEAGEELAPEVEVVLGYEVWSPISRPTVVRDITKHIDQKVAAISEYRSQLANCDWAEGARGLNAYRGITTGVGKYAEAFSVLRRFAGFRK